MSFMKHWRSYLNSDPTEWLLGEDNPSVRYFTLLNLLDKSANDTEVIDARQMIMEEGVVPKILAKQKPNGYWGLPENFYVRGKYKGTSWQLIILAELGANGKDERIKKTCEFMLNNSQDPDNGGFSYINHKEAAKKMGRKKLTETNSGSENERVIPCLTANMAWSLIRLGYLEDERVQKALQWIINHQRFDDESVKSQDWYYNKLHRCYGERTCHSIIVKSLKTFAEVPLKKRSVEMNDYITKGSEHMLNHHIHVREVTPSKGQFKWLEFGFPLMYNIDALEVLGLLTKLGYKDRRMQESLDIMISKQNDDGKWILENTFNGRYQVNIEKKGKPSKWITLNALRVLKNFFYE